MKFFDIGFFFPHFFIVDGFFDIGVCFLAHIIDKAHIVLIEIGKLLHFYLFVMLPAVLWVRCGNGLVLEVVIHIAFYYFIDDLLLLVVICLMHQSLPVSRSHNVALES